MADTQTTDDTEKNARKLAQAAIADILNIVRAFNNCILAHLDLYHEKLVDRLVEMILAAAPPPHK
jgi:hypothetical protein